MRILTERDLDTWFTYHPPDRDQAERYEALRDGARAFAKIILNMTPAGPDQSAAIRKVRMAMMTANAAIACEWKDNIGDVEAVEGATE